MALVAAGCGDEGDSPKQGVVLVTQLNEDVQGFGVGAQAVFGGDVPLFFEGNRLEPTLGCRSVAVTPAAKETMLAGSIRLTGGKTDIDLAIDSGGIYSGSSGLVGGVTTSRLWDDDQPLTVSATGGTVPPFELTLRPRSGLELTEPRAPLEDSPLTISREQDLAVKWTVARSERAVVELQVVFDEQPTSVRCYFEAGEPGGNIPDDLLQSFPSGTEATLDVALLSWTTHTVGDFQILFVADESAPPIEVQLQ